VRAKLDIYVFIKFDKVISYTSQDMRTFKTFPIHCSKKKFMNLYTIIICSKCISVKILPKTTYEHLKNISYHSNTGNRVYCVELYFLVYLDIFSLVEFAAFGLFIFLLCTIFRKRCFKYLKMHTFFFSNKMVLFQFLMTF